MILVISNKIHFYILHFYKIIFFYGNKRIEKDV